MKKTLFAMFAAALMLTGCSSDPEPEMNEGGNVNFTVQLPDGLNSRAYADGQTATQLTYALYNEDGSYIANSVKSDKTFSNLTTSVSLNLVTGKTYKIVFWAQAPTGTPYTFNENDGTITVTTTGDANAETRDAFFASETVVVNGPVNRTVTLTRPFAQINIGTSDLADFTANGGSITTSGMKVKGADVLNLLTGAATGEVEYTFADATLPTQKLTVKNGETETELDYITMNYLLVGTDKTTVDVTWTSDNASKPEVIFNSVPVQRNYRTNIYGALLTNPATFNVEIKPGMAGDDTNEEYDGAGFRVAHSPAEAQTLLDAGYAKVSVDGALFTGTASTQSLSRAGNVVEFFINKTVGHQILKITGQATADIKVSYKDAAAVAKQTFTLLVAEKINNVIVNLPGADVEVKGDATNGATAATGTITIENAGTATVDGSLSNGSIETGTNFDGIITVNATSAVEFDNAITAGNNIYVPTNAVIELPQNKTYSLVNGQEISVGGTIATNTGYQFQINQGVEASIIGISGGKSLIKGKDNDVEGRGIVQIHNGGVLNMENINLQTNYNPRGYTIDVEGGAVNLKNVSVVCDNAALCTIDGSTVNIEGGVFSSTASSDKINGITRQHNYTVRINGENTKGYIKNAKVNGVQGAVSVGNGAYCEIDGGVYTAAPTEIYKNSFYAVYAFTNGIVEIKNGYFKSSLHAIYDGNNDTTEIFAAKISLYGGFYSDKGYDQLNKTDINPETGYIYVATDNVDYPWQIVSE